MHNVQRTRTMNTSNNCLLSQEKILVNLDTHVHVTTVEKLKVLDEEGTIVWAYNNNDGTDNIYEDLLLGRVLTQSRVPSGLVRKAQAEAIDDLFEANRRADEAQKELESHSREEG